MVNGYAPKTLAEALELRSQHDLVPYAGGTDLMVENRPNVSYLFLGKLKELRGISEDADYVRIGAAVTYTEALASPPLSRSSACGIIFCAASQRAAPIISCKVIPDDNAEAPCPYFMAYSFTFVDFLLK